MKTDPFKALEGVGESAVLTDATLTAASRELFQRLDMVRAVPSDYDNALSLLRNVYERGRAFAVARVKAEKAENAAEEAARALEKATSYVQSVQADACPRVVWFVHRAAAPPRMPVSVQCDSLAVAKESMLSMIPPAYNGTWAGFQVWRDDVKFLDIAGDPAVIAPLIRALTE